MKKDLLKTALVGGETVKTDVRISFFGVVDELSCYMMELTHHIDDVNVKADLRQMVAILSKIMGCVAGANVKISDEELNHVLKGIEKFKNTISLQKGFVAPGITYIGAKVHIVRAVSRRAELAYAHVYEKYGGDELIFNYLNKLSTWFYYLAQSYDQDK